MEEQDLNTLFLQKKKLISIERIYSRVKIVLFE